MRFLLGILLSIPVFASVVQPGDGPYYRFRRGRILYVYDPIGRDSITQGAAYMESIRKLYDESYRWKLDEEQDLILTSPAQQIGNAYATISPNIKSVWFPSGPALLETMAESSWFLALATHETAHLYQLNAKGEFNSYFKPVFGNSIAIFPFVWPIFIHPNVLTPTFLVEGNAVFNESRANLGGRLHSGEARALVLAQIRAGQIDPTRLINNEFRFPYNQTGYLQGGYFQAHLAAKYGVDKTNQFFVAQGDHYLWPLVLNKTFRDHFGASYPQEIREYVREMESLAKNQNSGGGRTLLETKFYSPLNHDDKSIFFLSSDGVKPPVLHRIDKATGRDNSERLDIPLGKVFWKDGRPQVTSSQQHDLHHVEYSLYSEDYEFEPEFRGQIVNDQRGGKTAALDAANAWLDPHLLVNGENYDIAHSLPILDSEGNVYYFRQNGTERMLYKNRNPVFKYDGFYGRLLEVSKDGSIYFLANTDFGATVYRYQNGEIFRELESDTVVDARQLDDSHFVVVEVGADGHRAAVADSVHKPAKPSLYSYGFPNYVLKPEKMASEEELKSEERAYNSFSQMRYSSLDFSTGYDSSNGLSLFTSAHLTDPMQYQEYNFGAAGSAYGSQRFFAGYAFTKYLPDFHARYFYEKSLWHQHNMATRFAYNQEVIAGFTLPLLRWRHFDAAWTLDGIYNKNDDRLDFSTFPPTGDFKSEETYGTWNSIGVRYQVDSSPALALFPWRLIEFNYQNKLQSYPGNWRKKYNTSLVQMRYQQGFPLEFYAQLSGAVAWAENHDVRVTYDPEPLAHDIRIARLVAHDEYTAKTVSSARFEFTKVFNTPVYSARIPIGLARTSPFVIAQGIFNDSDGRRFGDYPASIFEWGYGADFHLLLLHLANAKLRIMNAFDTRHPVKRDDKVELNWHYEF